MIDDVGADRCQNGSHVTAVTSRRCVVTVRRRYRDVTYSTLAVVAWLRLGGSRVADDVGADRCQNGSHVTAVTTAVAY